MEFIKQAKTYKPKDRHLHSLLNEFWFIPSDVLQRSIEANIWDLCTFRSPVLDIGVGNGALTKFLFRNHPKMEMGIDIEERGIQEAEKTGKYQQVVCANAEKMPFKDASFNTVVSNSTFEHINNDLKAVSEVSRVLKKKRAILLNGAE
jgi:SAM-dependent methyltransferase